MARTTSFQLARIFGIRIGVSASWFFVLFLMIYVLSGYFQDVMGGSNSKAYAVAVASAIAFFGSIVLHELGHALVARRSGIGIAGIDLWFFGGIARLSRDSESPGEEFKVAVAGPVVTVLVIAACFGAGVAIQGLDGFVDVALLRRGASDAPLLVLLGWLGTINTALLVLNLVPALPLDGGRIARAIAWKVTGDRNRGTRIAGRLAQGFSYLMVAGGVALVANGDAGDGLWLILLGLFVGQAARGAVVQSVFAERIDEVTVADVMDERPITIPGETTLLAAEEEYFRRSGAPWLAVVDATGLFLGVLGQAQVDAALAAGRPALHAAEEVDRDDAERWRIGEDQPLRDLLGAEVMQRAGGAVAVDANGFLRGVVTVDRVRKALASATGGRLA